MSKDPEIFAEEFRGRDHEQVNQYNPDNQYITKIFESKENLRN